MDKELLKEYKLEDMQKRFQQICEYTFITTPMVDEDDEDTKDNQDDNEESTVDNNGMPDNNIGAADVNDESDESNPEFNPTDNGTDNREEDIDTDAVETTPIQDDDEVIDIDDLTSAQEESEIKIDGVDDKLLRLLNVVTNFQDALEQNSQKLEDLKIEFEKRNPTETEKLNLRSQDSYPYSEQPKDFWKNHKKENSKYDIHYDNNMPANKEQEEFNVTVDDIRGGNDREIAQSMQYNKLSDFLNY